MGLGDFFSRRQEQVPGIEIQDVQVSLHRLLKLLRSTGRSTGFGLSSAVVPVVDVRRLIEEEEQGSLDPSRGDPLEFYADGSVPGGAAFQSTYQIFNPVGSKVMIQLLNARLNNAISSTFNLELHDGPFPLAEGNGILVRGPAILNNANDDCQARFFGQDGIGVNPTRLKVIHQEQMSIVNATFEMCVRPLWIPPGRGVCMRNVANGAGTSFIGNYRFREYAL
jgi:hypothetical protein